MIDEIKLPAIKEFVKESLLQFAEGVHTDVAGKTAEIVIDVFKHKGYISAHSDPSLSDTLIASALLHDVFVDKKEWISVFYARKYLLDIAIECGVPEVAYRSIFETIESQHDFQTAIPRLRPQAGTPQDMFCTVLYVVKNHLV